MVGTTVASRDQTLLVRQFEISVVEGRDVGAVLDLERDAIAGGQRRGQV